MIISLLQKQPCQNVDDNCYEFSTIPLANVNRMTSRRLMYR